ncbi:hypothetical protein [Cellulomonas hominis]
MASHPTGARRHLPNSPFNAAREQAAAAAVIVPIPVGARVSHERHGLGRVVALSGETDVIVDFGEAQHRRVSLGSSKLERL